MVETSTGTELQMMIVSHYYSLDQREGTQSVVKSNQWLIVCQVDENYTSRVCNLCQQQSSLMVSLWGVLQCSICHHNWDRDHNASTNILNLGLPEYAGIDRPEVFSRSMPYEPLPSPTNGHGDENTSGDDDNNDRMEIDYGAVTPSQKLNLDFLNLNL